VSSRASLVTGERKMSAHAKNENPVPTSDTANNNYIKIDDHERSRTCAVLFYCNGWRDRN